MSTAMIGNVGGLTYTISVTPALTVAGAYTANDYVGTSAIAMTFAVAGLAKAKGGMIESALLVDYAAQNAAIELWLFSAAPTPPNDNAAWTITDAMALTCIGVIPFVTYYASGANSVCPVTNLGIAYNCAAAATSIYGCLVTRGAPTYATGDITVKLSVFHDAG